MTSLPKSDSLLFSKSYFCSIIFATIVAISVWIPQPSTFLHLVRYALFAAATSLVIVVLGPGGIARTIRHNFLSQLLVLLALYSLASSLWSESPLDALLKSSLLLLSLLACISISDRLSRAEIIAAIIMPLLIFVVLSAIVAVLFPSIGIESSTDHAGKWKGISPQKNALGMTASLLFILLLSQREVLPRIVNSHLSLRALFLLTAGACVVLSGSRGALLDLLVGVLVVVIFRGGERRRFFLVSLGLIITTFLLLTAYFTLRLDGQTISWLGIEADTSNRLLIWNFGLDQLEGRELFGVGMSGFWTEERQAYFSTVNSWVLPNFHNGYMTAYVELGIVGLALVSLIILTAIIKCFSRGKAIQSAGLWTTPAILVMFLVHNFYENNLVRSTDLFLILFFALSLSIPRK